MRDTINRNNRIAEENTLLTGHPARDKFSEWSTELIEKTDEPVNEDPASAVDRENTRLHRIQQMEEVIKEDLDKE